MADPAPARVVLAGGGHTHALVLREWARRPPPAEVTLVSDTETMSYSGMLPGEIAGHYRADQTQVDLAASCRAAGARLVVGRAAGIDRASRRLLLEDGASLPYTLLSLNVGATSLLQARGAADHAVAVKPIATFRERWEGMHQRLLARRAPATLAVVGGGAAGVELALAAQWRLRQDSPGQPVRLHLVEAGDTLLPAFPARVQHRFSALLAQRGIELHLGAPVDAVTPGRLLLADGRELAADEVLWVTQAGAAGWLRGSGLALDDQGFVRVDTSLRSVDDAAVFAAGDIASIEGERLRKSGVVAVRQAPVLAANLQRALADEPLLRWRPQRHWLSIVSTGGRHAVAVRGRWSLSGRWVWRWKDWIDRRFVGQFPMGSGA